MAARIFIRRKPCLSGVLFGGQNRTQCTKFSVDLDGSSELETSDGQSLTAKSSRRLWSYCINEVRLLGYMCTDPNQYLTERKPFVHFSLATNHFYRIFSGEVKKSVTWHNILVYDPFLQNFALNQLAKGSRVHISGMLMNKTLPLNLEETNKTYTCIYAQNIIFLKKGSSRLPDDENENENISSESPISPPH